MQINLVNAMGKLIKNHGIDVVNEGFIYCQLRLP